MGWRSERRIGDEINLYHKGYLTVIKIDEIEASGRVWISVKKELKDPFHLRLKIGVWSVIENDVYIALVKSGRSRCTVDIQAPKECEIYRPDVEEDYP